ncbi:MAG: aminotransferase class I/II-fold pyridoxal phosphate-dependent enzyme [Hyphomicrobiaceae bacterium]
MMEPTGLNQLAAGGTVSPFTELRRLLAGIEPGHVRPIDMTVGEPHEAMPDFIAPRLAEAEASLTLYPPIRCSDELRGAIANWLDRRYRLARYDVAIDARREVHPLNGSREGLFFALLPAVGRKHGVAGPAVLIPNPYFQAYNGSALAANARPVYCDVDATTGFLPDLDWIEAQPDLLAQTAAMYVCSPSNPQGAIASAAYLDRALRLARHHDFMLFVDECYSEIYLDAPPPGGLEVGAATADRFRNLIVFNSLSKRSNLPGLRSGFCAGDGDYLELLAEIRNLVAPQMPGPVQHAAAAAWSDETHVDRIRAAYRAKFDICDRILGNRLGYRRPGGGFFLWLDVTELGGGREAAVTLWKRYGVKVVPGAFLARPGRDGRNPGEPFVRVALVHDLDTTRDALERMIAAAP